jgi:hypothetical protein
MLGENATGGKVHSFLHQIEERDFAESKKNMETVLKNYVRSLFREHRKAA